MEFEELSEKIIGCAFTVYNKMGSGYLESVYERCILIELKKAGLQTETQKPIQVFYDDQIVGDFIADMIIEDCIIVELKVVRQLLKIYEVQLVNYLVSTGKDIGLLINFGSEKVQIKRKIRDLKDLYRITS
jgi:GxxExxY protein